MKKKILSIILIVIIVMIVSITTTYATNYLYNSNEVYYDNSESNLTSSDVQGAIDELYTEATNYSTINSKIGTDTLTTNAQTLTGAINELNTSNVKFNYRWNIKDVFKSLANGESHDVQFTPTPGTNLCIAGVAHVGANSASTSAYWTLSIKNASTSTRLSLGSRTILNIPVNNTWDQLNTAVFITNFSNADYIASFTNNMGVSTNGTYGSSVSLYCIPFV